MLSTDEAAELIATTIDSPNSFAGREHVIRQLIHLLCLVTWRTNDTTTRELVADRLQSIFAAVPPAIVPPVRSYTLQLPLPPAELHPNARVNWRAKHRVKAAYRQLCGSEAYLQIRSRPKLTAVQVAATFRRAVGRNGQYQQHDPDNLIAWLKTAIDSLQDSGLLADDRQVQYAHPRQERCDDNPGLELIVTGLSR